MHESEDTDPDNGLPEIISFYNSTKGSVDCLHTVLILLQKKELAVGLRQSFTEFSTFSRLTLLFCLIATAILYRQRD